MTHYDQKNSAKGRPLPCIKYGHPVTSFDRKLGALLDDLTATLKDAQGLGWLPPRLGFSAGLRGDGRG